MTVRLAYLSQEVARARPPALRVLDAVRGRRAAIDLGKGREITASQLCERFGFTGDAQWTPVGELSGGERRRLQLLRLLMDEPNVLLLDEPTNDLDVDTLTALEDLLDGWAGTLLVVSHDRYFLERMCDRTVALLGDGRLRDLPGGVDEYLARRRAVRAAVRPAAAGGADGGAAVAGAASATDAAEAAGGPQGDGPAGAPGGQGRAAGPGCTTRWRPRPPTTSGSALDAACARCWRSARRSRPAGWRSPRRPA